MDFLKIATQVFGIYNDFKSDAINYGGQTLNGGHNHIYNKGKDRTAAQKKGDAKKKKKKKN